MYPGSIDQPSPIQPAWLFEAAVRPSTLWEEYLSSTLGTRSPGTAGIPMSVDQLKDPVELPAFQAPDGCRGVALKLPEVPSAPATAARTVGVAAVAVAVALRILRSVSFEDF